MKLEKLKKGDKVGFVSLTNATDTEEFPESFQNAIEYYQSLGFETVLKQNLQQNYFGASDTVENRITALNELIVDDEIKMIVPIRGGTRFNQLIYDIDYKLIRDNPKWYGGFSDTSAFINLIQKNTGLPGFHGLDANYHIGEWKKFQKSLLELNSKTVFDPYNFTVDFQEINEYRPFNNKELFNNFRTNGLEFSGTLLGGHLGSTPVLLGSGCFDQENIVLMFETTTANESTLKLLYGLLELGLFKNVDGLILGYSDLDEDNFNEQSIENYQTLYNILEEILDIANKKYGKKIGLVKTNTLGHEIQNIIYPLGTQVKFDGKSKLMNVCN